MRNLRTAVLAVLTFVLLLTSNLIAQNLKSSDARKIKLSAIVRSSVRNDKSIALRNMKPLRTPQESEEHEVVNRIMPKTLDIAKAPHTKQIDPALDQRNIVSSTPTPEAFENFEGIGNLNGVL